ncbi:MAG: hypothetical protein QXQ66_06980, partial [Candidatus Hadarchaeum sp.]|uniref:hypothetical protein n=1 Tax=Candidatus Hadarchaeum sp. TaxID=2883567 RepID=UPI00317377A5
QTYTALRDAQCCSYILNCEHIGKVAVDYAELCGHVAKGEERFVRTCLTSQSCSQYSEAYDIGKEETGGERAKSSTASRGKKGLMRVEKPEVAARALGPLLPSQIVGPPRRGCQVGRPWPTVCSSSNAIIL